MRYLSPVVILITIVFGACTPGWKSRGLPADLAKLNQTWELYRMNGDSLSSEHYPEGLPYLQFDTRQGRIYGFDGCNDLGATIEVTLDRITIGEIMTTEKACPDRTGQAFLEKLAQVNAYKVDNQALQLSHHEQVLLDFRRRN